MLKSTSVINAVATDPQNLEEQRVGNADIFVACTGDDEDNLIMAVKSNELGAKQVMCTIGRPDYASVTKRLGIDVAGQLPRRNGEADPVLPSRGSRDLKGENGGRLD